MTKSADHSLDVTIIIPAYNAESTIGQVVTAALEMVDIQDIVVVDPSSSDGTADLVHDLGVKVVKLEHRAGPALARNIGVEHASSGIVLFIDSDCVPHTEVVERVRQAFHADADLVSLTGSYDEHPSDRGFFSQYMNLRHHYTHQVANQDNATFWAGCGAVRRKAFMTVKGFDADRYPVPQIEDIELGLRLAPLGRRRLDPALQVKHLKAWSLRVVVATDIRSRAIPWSQLILEGGDLPDDLNLKRSQRAAAALSPLVLLTLCASTMVSLGLVFPQLAIVPSRVALPVLAVTTLLIGLSVYLSFGLVRCFARLRGLPFAVGGWLFHQVHLTYSAVTFGICSVLHRLRR